MTSIIWSQSAWVKCHLAFSLECHCTDNIPYSYICMHTLLCNRMTTFMVTDLPYILCSGSLVDSLLDCQSPGSGFKPRPGQKFGSRFLFHLRPLANSAMMSTLTALCQWEDETVMERTGHPHSYALAKSVRIWSRWHFIPMASLRDCSSSSIYNLNADTHTFIHACLYMCGGCLACLPYR